MILLILSMKGLNKMNLIKINHFHLKHVKSVKIF
jgi:hypothetical protein